MLRGLLLASSLLFISYPSVAQHVYVWRDADGVMNYSDLPPVGGGVGNVRKLRINTFAEAPSSQSASALRQPSVEGRQVGTTTASRGREERLSDNRGATPYGGSFVGGGGSIAGGSGGTGASPASGSGSEGGARPLASGNASPSGSTTAATAPTPAVPIVTAPAPNQAVPIVTAPAPDQAVTISTAPAPDLAVPISTVPVTSSATTTPSGVTTPAGASTGGTWSQIASGSGGSEQATLYWDEVTKPPISTIPVAGYRVYVGENSGQYFQAPGQGINAGNVTSYTVQGLKSGTRYYFSVTTYVGGSESKKSIEVSKLMP